MKTRLMLPNLLTLALLSALSSGAQAFLYPSEFDTNNDGTVSSEEMTAGLTAVFTKIDTNNDGYLSLAEMQAWRDTEQVNRFKTLDTDNSTTLSLSELQAGDKKNHFSDTDTEKLFKLLDSDNNGSLTWDEYSLLEPSKGEVIRRFVHQDTDNDMQISKTEFLAPPSFGPHGHGGRHDR